MVASSSCELPMQYGQYITVAGREDSTNYYFPGFKTFLSRTIKNSIKYHSYLSFPKKERMVIKFELIANYPDHGCFTGKNIFCRVPNVHALVLYL
jgi:hypothetical protein